MDYARIPDSIPVIPENRMSAAPAVSDPPHSRPGGTRIRITEHFYPHGRTVTELMGDLLLSSVRHGV